MPTEPTTILPGSKNKPTVHEHGPMLHVPVEPVVYDPKLLNLPRVQLNVDEIVRWVATCGGLTDVSPLGPMWATVRERLAKLKVRLNRSAVTTLPVCPRVGTFNTGSQIDAINKCEDVESLQKVYAAIRLRYRLAAWHKRRGR